MKRILAAACALAFLVGCAARRIEAIDPARLALQPFTSRINLEWDGEQYSGSLSRGEQGDLTIVLSGASLLQPVTFVAAQGGCEISQGALSLKLDALEMPASSLPSALQNGFIMLQSASVTREKGEVILKAGLVQLYCREEKSAFSRMLLERGRINFTEFAFTSPSL